VKPNRHCLRQLMREAHCLVFPAYEDFGIVPVEAQACGTPVVGLAKGGSIETIVDGVSGSLVSSQTATALAEGVETLRPTCREAIRDSALRFSGDNFDQRFLSWFSAVA